MISPKSIAEVVETVQIEQVLEEFLDLRRAGSNLKGLCPFHDEKSPSFVVSPAKGIYKCFGCGKAGDSINFLMEHEKLSYPESIRWLANKYNISLEETVPSPEFQKLKEQKDSLYIINDFAQEQFHQNLLNTDEGKSIGLSYFKSRKFDLKTIDKWGLGYANNQRKDLYEALSRNKYNLELATKIGLIKEDRDFFNARITFPIRNLSGKVIGFGARTLSQNKKVPKYINSPESEIYNKRNVLFGMYHAKTSIRKQDNCFMVEGYTDVIRLSDGGIENIVASSGTSLTTNQIKLVKRFSQNITIIFDGDNAGIKAALRGMDIVLQQDMNLKLVLLPNGEDPDSYFHKVGAEEFKKFLDNNAEDFILFKVNLLLKETENDPIERSKVIKDIISSIAHIPDALKRNVYVQSCARLLDLREDVILQEANQVIARLQKKSNTPPLIPREEWKTSTDTNDSGNATIVQKIDSEHQHIEENLIRIIFNFGHEQISDTDDANIYEYIYENVEPFFELFDEPMYVDIIREGYKASQENKLTLKYWLQHEDPKFKKLAIDLSSEKHIYADWKSRGIELQTQLSPSKNYTKDTISSVLRFKLKKYARAIQAQEQLLIEVEKNAPDQLLYYIEVYKESKAEIAKLSEMLRSVVL